MKFFAFFMMGLGTVFSAEPSLQCRVSPVAPTLDGRLDEPLWQKAVPLVEGKVTMRGVVVKEILYLGIECAEWSGESFDVVMGNDQAVSNRIHMDVVVADLDYTTVYRLLSAPQGSCFDVKQTKNQRGDAWESQGEWSSQAKGHWDQPRKKWTVEFAVPITKGRIQAIVKNPKKPSTVESWHHIMVDQSQEMTKEAGPDLEKMSDEELKVLAERQAGDPAILEVANQSLEFQQKYQELLAGDESLSAKEFMARWSALAETYHIENTWGAMGLAAALKRASGEVTEEVEEVYERILQARPMMKAMAPLQKKTSDFQKFLLNSPSVPAFLQSMREAHGDDPFRELGKPQMYLGGMAQPFNQPFKKNDQAPGMPKKWEALSEEQFQMLRKHHLRPFTPAGKVLMGRTMKRFEKALENNPEEE